MTVDNSKSITIPVWLISILMSVLTATVISWGIISTVRTKIDRAEVDIETLRKEKIQRDEFNIVLNKLNSIESKLDKHIEIK